MSSPLVTIGVFVYNEDNYIKETIESIIKQTYKNIEIIISDNCSTDETSSIVSSFAHKDQRIKFFIQNTNIGAFENYKFVFDKSIGMYFMCMGGHDVLAPTLIEQAIETFEKNERAILVYPNSEFIDVEGKRIGKNASSDIDNMDLNKFNGIVKLIQNLVYCTPVYGLFIKSYLQKIPLIKMVGLDHLMLFYTSYLGGIVELSDVSFYRREIRGKENNQQQLERYNSQGVHNNDRHPHYYLFTQHVKAIFSMNDFSLTKKYKLVKVVWRRYKRLFKLNKKMLFKYIFKSIVSI